MDERKIAFNPAVELSYLKPEEQTILLDAMDSEQATPSLSQAQRLKQFSQQGRLSEDVMRAILSEEKKMEVDRSRSATKPYADIFHAPTRPNRWKKLSSSSWRAGTEGVSNPWNGDSCPAALLWLRGFFIG